MKKTVTRLIRRLNWFSRTWSTARDRAFHNTLFESSVNDPFSDAYPGRLSIRRFADLAVPHIRPTDQVLDLGCGPGEITCELARRLPTAQFVGVDHSDQGLRRAQRLADDRQLTNIRFELNDLERYEPHDRYGLVTMFDAFHHLLDPGAFIRRVGRYADRFFLIEPAGNSLGQWQKTADLDWLIEAVLVIRDRLEYQFGLAPTQSSEAIHPAVSAGEPIEHRYTIEDFRTLFDGFGVDMCGTIAGLESYGARPLATSSLRSDIGRSMFDLVVQLEEILRRHDLDLAAKHWAIYAERGASFPRRQVPQLPPRPPRRPLAGAYDVEYDVFEGPEEVKAGTEVDAAVRVVNRSWRVWDSAEEAGPVFLSYHWLDVKGATVVEEGLRSPLPRPIPPGESCKAALRIRCPDKPGRLTLAVDLVHERVTWFSQAGAPPLRVPIRVIR
jgi:SAM-dependent methyltransferase